MRTIFTFLFLSAISLSLNAQWAYKGLGSVLTHQLTFNNDTVYASTSGGLYKKHVNSTDTIWHLVSFGGKSVLSTLFLDGNECLVLVATDPVYHKAVLYKSLDRGANSSIFISDTVDYGYPNLSRIVRSPHSADTVYSLLHGKKTFDGGQSWILMGPQAVGGNFIYINPSNSKELFTGGENMIFSATLQHTTDNGQNWNYVDCSTVFAGDNALEVFHVVRDYWYAAGEGIVVKKHRDSSSWVQLLNVFSNPHWALYMFGFDFSPVNDHYMYVSGDVWNNDKVKLLKSSDQGQTWDSIYHTKQGQTRYGTYDLKVQHTGGNDIVWLGGFGVYTYSQPVPLKVDSKLADNINISLYPNPATYELHISLKGKSKGMVTLKISNASGQKIFEQEYKETGNITVPVKEWASGVYSVHLNVDEIHQTLKFVKR